MKYKIDKSGENLNISVTDVEGKRDQILKAFQDCKDGNCSCKTSEYEKVESFEMQSTDSDVQLIIKTKDKKVIDPTEIEKCLELTKANLSE